MNNTAILDDEMDLIDAIQGDSVDWSMCPVDMSWAEYRASLDEDLLVAFIGHSPLYQLEKEVANELEIPFVIEASEIAIDISVEL